MVKEVRILAAVVGAISLGACSDSPTTVPQRSLAETGPSFLVVSSAVPGPSTSASPSIYPLYAGGGGGGTGTQVGTVSVYSSLISGNHYSITVTYNLTTGCLTETHLAIALTTDGIPQKNGNPTPGQFSSKHTLSCTTTDTYTINFDMGSGSDNAVVIAAHAAVTQFGGANFVSGSSMPGTVKLRRPGNQVGFTSVNSALVAAWEPTNNPSDPTPSYWDTVIAADPSGNGSWLLSNSADWVWESFRTQDPIQGTVIEADLTVSVPVATTGTFRITCDNGYRVDLNGTTITNGGDGATAGFTTQLSTAFATDAGLATNTNLKQANVSAHGWQTVEAYNVSLVAGANLFKLYAVNEYMNPDDSHPAFPGNGAGLVGAGPAGPDPVGTADINPAGCIFGLAAAGTGSETAWGAPTIAHFTGATTGSNEFGGNFGGANWATYFTYQVR